MPKTNKLVRDKIPEIIAASGRVATTRILNDVEYPIELEKKLHEEVEEYIHDKSADELADILEVVYALSETLGVSKSELEAIRQAKANERGGFEEKIFLEDIQD